MAKLRGVELFLQMLAIRKAKAKKLAVEIEKVEAEILDIQKALRLLVEAE